LGVYEKWKIKGGLKEGAKLKSQIHKPKDEGKIEKRNSGGGGGPKNRQVQGFFKKILAQEGRDTAPKDKLKRGRKDRGTCGGGAATRKLKYARGKRKKKRPKRRGTRKNWEGDTKRKSRGEGPGGESKNQIKMKGPGVEKEKPRKNLQEPT